jgi:hypothetical protein
VSREKGIPEKPAGPPLTAVVFSAHAMDETFGPVSLKRVFFSDVYEDL